MSKFKGKKTDNAAVKEKESIRLMAFDHIGAVGVVEFFSGSGEMYRSVWSRSKMYLGVDRRKFFDERNTICGDCSTEARKIDLSKYNVFDIDAYGSPYTVINNILNNQTLKRDRKLFFVVTDGTAMDLRLGRICIGIRSILGIFEHDKIKRAHHLHDALIDRICETVASRLSMDLSFFVKATGKTGSKMKYYAFLLTPKNDE